MRVPLGRPPIIRAEPSALETLFENPGSVGMCRRIFRIELQRLIEQRQRLVVVRGRVGRRMREGAKIEVIGIQAFRPLVTRTLDLCAPEARLDGANDALGQSSCRSKTSSRGPSNLSAQTCVPAAPSIS